MTAQQLPYYSDKTEVLSDLFQARDVEVNAESITVDGRRLPVVDDVIVLLPRDQYTKRIVEALGSSSDERISYRDPFATDIQYTFGQEWQAHPEIMAENEDEFRQYFDLVDVDSLVTATVCDLGCGSGRWSYYLRNRCRQLILVDFSDAIFVARRNLHDCPNALFFMADVTNLPFRPHFADLVVCLGVLHHLPVPALYAVRRLRRLAPRILVYLYYAVDNRPAYFRPLLATVDGIRKLTSRIRGPRARRILSWSLTLGVYVPLVWAGKALDSVGLGKYVPLYDTYGGKSVRRIRQDAYDRFFTRIEQRVSKSAILGLRDTFASVTISENLPYWHFLCEAMPDDQPNSPPLK
jgi:SAM-dependent methyltransferase